MVDGTLHTTSIRATRKSVIFKISKKDLLNFLNKHPGLFVIITDFKYVEWKNILLIFINNFFKKKYYLPPTNHLYKLINPYASNLESNII